jgi:hypothetical protein
LATNHQIVRTRRRAFHSEPGRINVQLLPDDLRHSGEDALASFDKGAAQQHRAVGMDFQEGGHARAGLHRRGSRTLSTDAAIRHRDAKYKCAERGAKKTAAGKIDRPILGQRLRLKKSCGSCCS